MMNCEFCGSPDIVYAVFSGGKEYYCGSCQSNQPYPDDADLPPRIQMIRDGEFDKLRAEMQKELSRRKSEE